MAIIPASRDSETRVDADSLFRIMSMSKPITGMAVGNSGEELGRYIVLEMELPCK